MAFTMKRDRSPVPRMLCKGRDAKPCWRVHRRAAEALGGVGASRTLRHFDAAEHTTAVKAAGMNGVSQNVSNQNATVVA